MVALGNPGARYAETRHNAGFMLADLLRDRWRLPRFRDAGPAAITGGEVLGEDIILVKPQTYMNASGEAVRPLLVRGLDAVSELLVITDDHALPVGTLRLRARGSAGGHNGLASVEDAVGDRDYARLRIGIGPLPDDVESADFVLSAFPADERAAIDALLPTAADAVECWITDGIDTAMNRFNQRGTESE